MSDRIKTSPPMKTAAAAALMILVLLLESPLSRGAEPAPPAPMTGTVVAVNAQERKVQVVTGVGHALRVMEFRAGSECRIVVSGATADLQQVRRGAIVEVRYRMAAGAYEATAIETLEPKKGGSS